MQKILYVKVLFTLNSMKENKCFSFTSHLDCTLLYNLIRYRRFFDIIEFMCRFNIELQLRPSIKQFKY